MYNQKTFTESLLSLLILFFILCVIQTMLRLIRAWSVRYIILPCLCGCEVYFVQMLIPTTQSKCNYFLLPILIKSPVLAANIFNLIALMVFLPVIMHYCEQFGLITRKIILSMLTSLLLFCNNIVILRQTRTSLSTFVMHYYYCVYIVLMEHFICTYMLCRRFKINSSYKENELPPTHLNTAKYPRYTI